MNGLQQALARHGMSLLIGVPALGNVALDHAPATQQAPLPAGWRHDVGSGTSITTGMVKAFISTDRTFTDPSMIEIRIGSSLRAGTQFSVPEQSIDALVDEYAPFISPNDAAIVRRLAGSMSSKHGDPSRDLIYETY